MSEMEWQPVRVAPTERWCRVYVEDTSPKGHHWAEDNIARIVHVRFDRGLSKCAHRPFLVLDADKQKLKGWARDWNAGLWIAECQFHSD